MEEDREFIDKNLKILNKFYNMVLNTNDIPRLNGMINSWNKYKYSFETDNNNVLSMYYNIENLIRQKNQELTSVDNLTVTESIKNKYNCQDIQNSDELKRNVLRYIADNLNYHINILNQNKIDSNFENFTNWLSEISNCIDLKIFQHYIIEMLNKAYRLGSSQIDIYIDPKSTLKPMSIGDVLDSPQRVCSTLSQNECGGDCQWVKGKLFGGNCVERNRIDILYDNYCSLGSSYRTKEELIILIKSIYTDNLEDVSDISKLTKSISAKIRYNGEIIDLNNYSIEELCKFFKVILSTNISKYGLNTPEGVHRFFKNINVSQEDIDQMYGILENDKKEGKSMYQSHNSLINWIKNNKILSAGIGGGIAAGLVILGLYAGTGQKYDYENSQVAIYGNEPIDLTKSRDEK